MADNKKNFKIQDSVTGYKKSKIARYQELVLGSDKIWYLIKYELIILFFSGMPGALGIFLRSKFLPKLLGSCGRGVVFGRNIVFRHPQKINIGNGVIIDDNVLMDAKGNNNKGIQIKEEVFIWLSYRYHYQKADGSTIFRYDNAPHHRELSTYPDHKHSGESIIEVERPDIEQVLDEIKKHITW